MNRAQRVAERLGINLGEIGVNGAGEAGAGAAGAKARMRAYDAQHQNHEHLSNDEHLSERPRLVRLSDVQPRPVRWLWRDRIPLGKISVVDGDPGLGKSLMTLDLTARVTTAAAMPDGTLSDLGGPAGVVLLSAEDDVADTIRPRLEAAGADLDRVTMLADVPRIVETPEGVTVRREPPTIADVGALEAAIAETGAALVIIDPLMAYIPGDVNAHRDHDVRRALAPLAAMAARTGVAVVIIRHLNKTGGNNPLYRGGGSIGIIGAARAGLLVACDPDDPERRIVAVTKMNLGREAPSLAYRIDDSAGIPRVAWLGHTAHTASSVLAAQAEQGADRGALDEAIAFLRDALASGPVAAREVQRQARAAGISEATLRRARQAAGARAERTGGLGSTGAWVWRMADTASLPGHESGADAGLPDGGGTAVPPKMLISPLRCSSLEDEHLREGMSILGAEPARPPVQGALSAYQAPGEDSGGISQIDARCTECGAPLSPGERYRCAACRAVAEDAQRLVDLIRAGEATLDAYRAEIEAAPPDDPSVAHDRRVLAMAERLLEVTA